MGPGIVSLLFAIGVTTWIYTKFQYKTGNDTKRSLMGAGVAGLARKMGGVDGRGNPPLDAAWRPRTMPAGAARGRAAPVHPPGTDT